MNISDQRSRSRPKQAGHSASAGLSERVYPLRHCLMITGAILIVIDIGLFLGGIAIIAAGIDMDTYGFAAMISFAVLTMVFACMALICGCRARPPRSAAYDTRSQQHGHIPIARSSPKKVRVPVSASQRSVQNRFAPVPTQPRPPVACPPQVILLQLQRPPAQIWGSSVSECSHNATYGGGSMSNERQVKQHQQYPIQKTMQYSARVT